MISVLVSLICVVSIGHCAPTADANPLLTQQFVVLTPPQAAQSIQYESVLKLDQPLFQQITPLGRIETPQKQQLLLLYPNGPLTQYPLISLRQDPGNPDIWQTIQNFFTSVAGNFGQTDAPPPAAPPATSETIKIDPTIYSDNKPNAILEAPALPATSAAGLLPASTLPLAEKRYYILSGQPQLYGKYNALQAPLNSVFHLQPLHAIDSRSASAAVVAGDGAAAPLTVAPEVVQTHAAAVPLQTGVPLQLRSAFQEPLQAFEPAALSTQAFVDQPAAEVAAPFGSEAALKNNAGTFNQDEARSLVVLSVPETAEPAEQLSQQAVNDIVRPAEVVARSNSDAVTVVEEVAAVEVQPSVANARPTGVAVAGRGGLASAKPSATALVGDNGLAMASPMATAISGEFKEADEEEIVVEEVIEEDNGKKKFD